MVHDDRTRCPEETGATPPQAESDVVPVFEPDAWRVPLTVSKPTELNQSIFSIKGNHEHD
jgi:hypothetical protein